MANNLQQNIRVVTVEISNDSQSYDLRGAWQDFVIYENVFEPFITGSVIIYDGLGIRELMPIIGEETIRIIFQSRKESGEYDDLIDLEFDVYKFSNLIDLSHKRRGYKLNLISKSYRENVSHRNRKHHKDLVSNIVTTIVTNQLNSTMVDVDPTIYEKEIIFPNVNPVKAISMISECCSSLKYNDPFYLFFEDRDGYRFVSLSYLMDNIVAEDHIIKAPLKGTIKFTDSALKDQLSFVDYHSLDLFNISKSEISGMYGNTLIDFDKANNIWTETETKYSDEWNTFIHLNDYQLTKTKIESPKNRFQVMLSNQDSNPGIYIDTQAWVKQRLIRASQIQQNSIQVMLSGHTSIHAGDLVKFNFPSIVNNNEKDKILSDKYLLTKIKHHISPSSYFLQGEIIKDSYFANPPTPTKTN